MSREPETPPLTQDFQPGDLVRLRGFRNFLGYESPGGYRGHSGYRRFSTSFPTYSRPELVRGIDAPFPVGWIRMHDMDLHAPMVVLNHWQNFGKEDIVFLLLAEEKIVGIHPRALEFYVP